MYTMDDKEWGGGLHVHYFRTIDHRGKWALGGSLEQAWAGGSHFTIGAGAKFAPIELLEIAVMPGVTFAHHKDHGEDEPSGHEEHGDTYFSAHFELVCNLFHWGGFHLGPSVDYSWSQHDSHIMLGVHGAFSF